MYTEDLAGTVMIDSAAVLTTTLVGLAALWAATCGKSWLPRWGPLILLLASVVATGAYEFVAVYVAQTATIIGTISASRLVRARRAAILNPTGAGDSVLDMSTSPAGPAVSQFFLVDLLKAIVFVAVLLAILRHALLREAVSAGASWQWWSLGPRGAAFGAITLLAAQFVWGTWSFWLRIIVFLVGTVVVGGAAELLPQSMEPIYFLIVGHGSYFGWRLLVVCLQALATAIVLVSLDAANWDWRAHRAARDLNASPPSWRWAARAFICTFALLGGGFLGNLFWALLPPRLPPPEPLPKPNGHDDFVRASSMLNWAALPNQDFDAASISACQAFLQANAEPLALMREGLDKPCFMSVDYADPFRGDLSGFGIRWALWVEVKVALAAEKHDAAVHSYLDIIRLGHAYPRGGLLADQVYGDGLIRDAFIAMTPELKQLDAEQLSALQTDLIAIPDSNESWDAKLERERPYLLLVYGWWGRLGVWCHFLLAAEDQIFNQRTSVVAQSHLMIAEIAIRRYALAEGSPPKSLAALVPEYLSAVPLDPYTDGPLVYRRTADGYLLYSVGSNRIDDGGLRVSFDKAIYEGTGDLFFDAARDQNNSGNNAVGSPVADQDPTNSEAPADAGPLPGARE